MNECGHNSSTISTEVLVAVLSSFSDNSYCENQAIHLLSSMSLSLSASTYVVASTQCYPVLEATLCHLLSGFIPETCDPDQFFGLRIIQLAQFRILSRTESKPDTRTISVQSETLRKGVTRGQQVKNNPQAESHRSTTLLLLPSPLRLMPCACVSCVQASCLTVSCCSSLLLLPHDQRKDS